MMNNTINEIKISIEGISSRITEVVEQISELEDRMVGITTAEQSKENKMKRIEDSLRDLWENKKMHQYSNYRGPVRRREKERV